MSATAEESEKARRAARAVLRPGLRLRADPGDREPLRRPLLGRPAARAAGARRHLVGLGRVRLADQRSRHAQAQRAAGDLLRDGGDAARVAGHSRAPSRATRCCSPWPTWACGSPTSGCSPPPPTTRPCASPRARLAVPARLRTRCCLIVASAFDGTAQVAIWVVALCDRLRGRRAARHRGLAPLARSLRRAPRPDRDHRPGRVDRGHRGGGRGRRPGRRGAGSGHARASCWRPRCGGPTSTARSSRWSERAELDDRSHAQHHRARLLQLPPPAADRGHRAAGAGRQEDAGGRRRAAESRGRLRPVRRRRALPGRRRRLPPPLPRHARRPAPGGRRRGAGAHAAGGRAAGAGLAGLRVRGGGGAGGLRGAAAARRRKRA